MITHVAFDADDTLWHSEGHYRDAQAAYEKLLAFAHEARRGTGSSRRRL